MLSLEDGRWVLADNASAGIYAGSQDGTAQTSGSDLADRGPSGPELGDRMDLLALILSVAALVMFAFAASGRELRHFNEIALGLVFLTAALISQFTATTNTHIGR